MTRSEFKKEVLDAMVDKPEEWRNGQFVFNYIDNKYGIARTVQFSSGIDCFYLDDRIDEFIDKCYETYSFK